METIKSTITRIIVQASSRGWTGERDLCLRETHGKPLLHWTIGNILDALPTIPIVIAAPEYDRGGELETLRAYFEQADLTVFYGHDAEPFLRLIEICADLEDHDYILRVVGLHFCVDLDNAAKMAHCAHQKDLDCVSLPDDFNPKFNSDVFRVGALRNLKKQLQGHPRATEFMVHPKFFMFSRPDCFRCLHFLPVPSYSDQYLHSCRDFISSLQEVERHEVTPEKIWAGDQISFHYEYASRYLTPAMTILDVACGDGTGMEILATAAGIVHGADVDQTAITHARQQFTNPRLHFHVEDVTDMSFAANSFDAVTSFETLEHVDSNKYLLEIKRILKPGGYFILSTPQNSIGHIPTDPYHLREYSLKELQNLVAPYFDTVEVVGLKAGRIVIEGDPIGSNTILVMTNAQREHML